MRFIRPLVRWVAVFAGASLGSWAGRLLAARLYGEPLDPLLRLNLRMLLNQDVAPGMMAVELFGRLLRLNTGGQVALAAITAATSAIVTGPHTGAQGAAGDTANRHWPARRR